MTEPGVEEVAMSLCALGRTISDDDTTKSSDIDQSLSDVVAAAAHLCVGSESTTTHGFATENISSSSSLRIHSLISQTTNELSSSSTTTTADNKGRKNAAVKKVRAATKHDVVKPRTKRTHQHHRDFSITLDEMERLMRVYGSLKCLRNRTPLASGRSTKVESVKRKFYRWFPDLEERFIRTEEGWYSPKAGHEEEIQYREAMRKGDQDSLVKKRNIRRSSSKSSTATPAV